MKNILAIGASTSSTSINKTFVQYAASKIEGATVVCPDLNDFEMPIYSSDRQKEDGIHELAHKFNTHIQEADGIIISFAEHNGNVTAAFKNLFDWVSVIDQKIWAGKPMLLLATSPGKRGGQSALGIVLNDFPHRGGSIAGSFSLPSFFDNFKDGAIQSEELQHQFDEQLALFIKALG